MSFFEGSENKERKSHFKNLVKLMAIDGIIAESERRFLRLLGQKWGLTDQQFQKIISKPDKIKFTVPKDENKNFSQLVDLINMMLIDNIIDRREMDFCMTIASKFGFRPSIVSEVAAKIKEEKERTVLKRKLLRKDIVDEIKAQLIKQALEKNKQQHVQSPFAQKRPTPKNKPFPKTPATPFDKPEIKRDPSHSSLTNVYEKKPQEKPIHETHLTQPDTPILPQENIQTMAELPVKDPMATIADEKDILAPEAQLTQFDEPKPQPDKPVIGQEALETVAATPAKNNVGTMAEEKYVPDVWNVGDVILDLYEVKEVYESGGMGLVYKAYHKGWKVDLAVKSPRGKFFQTEGQKENFIRECETWINLGLHPNIVSCFYVRKLGGIPRVFAEYVDGGSLSDWIRDRKLYEGGVEKALERILDVAIQFAWGLQYSHEQGVVHQDVKPGNVLITKDGTVKVTDFGLAKARAIAEETPIGDPQLNKLVSSGGMTPAYCSPEQANKEKLSHKTDIWSWGVSVLEMFTGEVTWMAGQAALEALDGYLEMSIDDETIPKMPEALAELLKHCFQQEPETRPKDMLDIVSVFQEIYQQSTDNTYNREAPKPAEALADSLNNRALSYLDLGREEEAERCWQRAIKHDPQHTETVFNLGYCEWHKGEITDKAYLIRLKEMENSQKSNPVYWYNLGLVQLERGKVNEAKHAGQRAKAMGYAEADLKVFQRSDLKIIDCLKIMKGHSNIVNSVCFSPDGRYALSGSNDKTLHLWEIATGILKKTMVWDIQILSVCFSPDGKYALFGGTSYTLYLLEIATGYLVKTLEGHTGAVYSVCFSPDGKYAISGSADKTIRLWDVCTGNCIKTMKDHTDIIRSVCFSPDGKYAISGSADKTIRLWDLYTGNCIKTIKGHMNEITSVCFSPDGRYALSGSWDMTIRLWNIFTGRCSKILKGHTKKVESVCFSADGMYALSGGRDDIVRLWEINTGRCLRSIENKTDYVYSVCFSPNDQYALLGGGLTGGFKLQLWEIGRPGLWFSRWLCRPQSSHYIKKIKSDIEKYLRHAQKLLKFGNYQKSFNILQKCRTHKDYERNSEILGLIHACACQGGARIKGLKNTWNHKILTGHTDKVTSVCFSPDGKYALSGSLDNTLRLWEIPSTRCLDTMEDHNYGVASVGFSSDGKYLLSESGDNVLHLWDLATSRCIKTFKGRYNLVNSVCYSPNGKYALSGRINNNLPTWEISTAPYIKTLKGHNLTINSFCFSPNNRYALSESLDKTIRLWESETGHCIKILKGHNLIINSFCFSPNNRYILSGSWDKTIRLWDSATGHCLKTMDRYTGLVESVCFSPDSHYALSGSTDNIIRLWDVVEGSCLKFMKGHTDWVTSVCFSPDARYALSGSHDKTIRLWEFDWEWEFPGEKVSKPTKPQIDHGAVQTKDASPNNEAAATVLENNSVPISEEQLIQSAQPQENLQIIAEPASKDSATIKSSEKAVPDKHNEAKFFGLVEKDIPSEILDQNDLYKVGDKIENRYEVHKVLKGGMGVVYICYDRKTGNPYAVKTFQKKLFTEEAIMERFLVEAETWVKLEKHKNIVRAELVRTIENPQKTESMPYIFMEYVVGGDLGEYIKRGMKLEQVLDFAIQFCRGMDYAYRKLGIVHRDIKPANILVTINKTIKITDFGLVKVCQAEKESYSETSPKDSNVGELAITHTNAVMGTPPYMSPEQCKNSQDIDIRSDIYSFGAVLYEMLTQRYLFEAENIIQFLYCHQHEKPQHPRELVSGLPEALDNMVMKCLEKEPKRRYRDFGELMKDLCSLYQKVFGQYVDEVENPEELEVWEIGDKGISLDELGKHKEAIACYDKVIKSFPEDDLAWANKGYALYRSGHIKEAIACYDKALKLIQQNNLNKSSLKGYLKKIYTNKSSLKNYLNKVYTNKGNALCDLGRYKEALVCYEQALEQDTQDAQAWYNIGASLDTLGQSDRAINYYDHALRLNPKYAHAWGNKGNSLLKLGRYKEALICCNKSLKLNPNGALTWNNKGTVLMNLKQFQEAHNCFDKALELDPQHVMARCNKGGVLVELGQYKEAITHFDQALELNPEFIGAWCNKGLTLFYMGKKKQALAQVNRALAIDPFHSGARRLKKYIAQSR